MLLLKGPNHFARRLRAKALVCLALLAGCVSRTENRRPSAAHDDPLALAETASGAALSGPYELRLIVHPHALVFEDARDASPHTAPMHLPTASDAETGLLLPELRDWLSQRVRDGRPPGAAPGPPAMPVEVWLDRDTRFELVTRVLYTGSLAGVSDWRLVVRSGGGLAYLPVLASRLCETSVVPGSPDEPRREPTACATSFVNISKDGLGLEVREDVAGCLVAQRATPMSAPALELSRSFSPLMTTPQVRRDEEPTPPEVSAPPDGCLVLSHRDGQADFAGLFVALTRALDATGLPPCPHAIVAAQSDVGWQEVAAVMAALGAAGHVRTALSVAQGSACP